MKSDKYKFIIIGLILFIFSFIFIVLCNGTYNYKLKLDNIHNIDELDIQVKQKKDIVKIIDSRINNNNLELTLKPLCKGKVYIDINSQDDDYFEIFYRTFNTSYSYTKIGHIDDLPVLQNDVIKVRIEK